MTTKKSKPAIRTSDDLAAIDVELNRAIEQLELSNTKVAEILTTTAQPEDIPAADATAEASATDGSDATRPKPDENETAAD
jgi:hypothetical protein